MKYLILLVSLMSCSADECSLELAKKYMDAKQVKESINCYNYLTATQDSMQAYNALAAYYWKAGQNDSSIKYYGKLLLWNKVPLYAIINLGDSYYKTGDHLKALNAFLWVERHDSLYPTVNYNLAMIYMQKFELYNKALEFAFKEYNLDTLNAENINLVGQLYMNTDSAEKAIHYFSKSITVNPANHLTYFLRAMVYASKNENVLAYNDLVKCLSINPDFIDGLNEKIKIGALLKKNTVCADIAKLKQLVTEIDSGIISIQKRNCHK